MIERIFLASSQVGYKQHIMVGSALGSILGFIDSHGEDMVLALILGALGAFGSVIVKFIFHHLRTRYEKNNPSH